MNVNKFKTVNFEFNTIDAPIDYSGSFVEYVCDDLGNPLGFRKKSVFFSSKMVIFYHPG